MIKINADGFKSAYIMPLASLLSEKSGHDGVINARMVDSEEVRRLNREYSGKDEPTDVLSFNYREKEDNVVPSPDTEARAPEPELGDIVISREHVKRQAKAAGTNEETEFILLLLHGALHIMGYDHHSHAECGRMDSLQREIMLDLGLPYRDFGWQKQ